MMLLLLPLPLILKLLVVPIVVDVVVDGDTLQYHWYSIDDTIVLLLLLLVQCIDVLLLGIV